MNILLVVVGLVVVFISYFISETFLEKREKEEKTEPIDTQAYAKEIWNQNQEQWSKDAKEMVNETVEMELNRVDNELRHISNEKIMAVSEFSDQLLEKIEQNHKEVVFLYDMLNEKENEMKEFVQEIDKSKVVLEELANKELEKQKMLQHKRIQKELEKQLQKQEELEREKIELMQSGMIPKKPEESLHVTTQVSALEKLQENQSEAQNEPQETVVQPEEVETPQSDPIANTMLDGNQNQVILDLYNEGKSIMEIAKVLGKGQGEVKLVIDLFQGANRT
ncbi:MAG: hypothetical protein II073_09875 [Lachnospiraceae bacterium]|nr:hypothetical protein [Lachnospiraceae bacterium]